MAAEPLDIRAEPAPFADVAAAEDSSHVRSRRGALPSRAQRRVAEYLRALGLVEPRRIAELSEQIAASAAGGDADSHAVAAVSEAQERFAAWHSAVFGAGNPANPLWLREFLATFPAVALGDVRAARRAARRFFDPHTGDPPRRATFREQTLEPGRLLKRLPPAVWPALTLLGISALIAGVSTGALGGLWLSWAGLWLFLALSGAVGLLTSALGFWRSWRTEDPKEEPRREAGEASLPRTALVMPIYHESAEHVFAALAAMRESLLALPELEPASFEIFVLSDSRDPSLAAEEERAFRRVASSAGTLIPIFYRRRAQNVRHKAGNLAEFFERWGHRYEYAIVLDADSLMAGATVRELVRRMQASPQLALLQAPIALHGGETPFARVLQFASSVFGPLFTSGLAAWSGAHANYYGHNAILRVRAFLACCALPRLAGKPPLGGDILSHDFVEAALLCRAGWEVRIASDLSGSFEGLPQSVSAYVARDRRWCQGNLQHVRVACARGLAPTSRLHLLLGAFAYLEAPAWLLFVALGIGLWHVSGGPFAQLGWAAAVLPALLLLGPQLLGMIFVLRDQERSKSHGGRWRVAGSFAVALVAGAFIAPLILLHRAEIVFSLLLGRAVGWGAQQRAHSAGFAREARAEALATLLGLALPCILWLVAPGLLWWLAPAWIPWLLSIPLAWLLSSPAAGAWSRRLGWFLVPSETLRDELLERARALRALTSADDSARFRDLVLDPVLLSAHLSRLGPPAPHAREWLQKLQKRALRRGPAALSHFERSTLASDSASMGWLHREGWRHWPVESWQLARERPLVPADSQPYASEAPEPEPEDRAFR